MTYRLLVSAPGDVLESDLRTVELAVNRWNAIYGHQFGAVVIPTHWRQHSAAEHGKRPQESLNDQLVDKADAVLVLFWGRLGTPTGEAGSGTQEELTRAADSGAYVAVLRCERPIDPSDIEPDQVSRLNAALDALMPDSLVLGYQSDGELAQHVDTILTRVVTRGSERAEAAADASSGSGGDVWPRIETTESVKTDTRGRAKTERKWHLVLTNSGDEPARNVSFRLEAEREDEAPPEMLDSDRELEVLAPGGGEASYGLFLHSGVASQTRCVVTWSDSRGKRENAATLRFF